MTRKRDAALIEASGLFDPAWYLAEYPDVALSGMDALEHFLTFGARLLRNPGPHFDARRYAIAEKGSLREDVNPLVHHLLVRSGAAAASGSTATAEPLRIAIKIAATNHKVKKRWGDYHFAISLQRALARLGHSSRIDVRPAWHGEHCRDDQVVLVLRGRFPYWPMPEHLNLMWNISHPEDVTLAEYEGYDHVFIASSSYAPELSRQLNVPVTPLLQCTDPEHFNPHVDPVEPSPGLLFVGNSRNVYRRIVKDFVEAGFEPEVYGGQWEGFLPEGMIKGTNIPNHELAGYYRACRCLLNDHWDDMRARGFLSNRLFDAIACRARVISDRVEGLERIFGDAVLVYDNPDDIPALIGQLDESEPPSEEIAESVLQSHSFDARAKAILCTVNELLEPRHA